MTLLKPVAKSLRLFLTVFMYRNGDQSLPVVFMWFHHIDYHWIRLSRKLDFLSSLALGETAPNSIEFRWTLLWLRIASRGASPKKPSSASSSSCVNHVCCPRFVSDKYHKTSDGTENTPGDVTRSIFKAEWYWIRWAQYFVQKHHMLQITQSNEQDMLLGSWNTQTEDTNNLELSHIRFIKIC